MKLLIKSEEFNPYKDISENLDAARLATYIGDAQYIDLRGFLGAKLYTAMLADYDEVLNTFTEPRFTELFDGALYNGVAYYGLEPALVQYSYARLLDSIQLNVTRAGVRKFDAEESEEVEQSQISIKVANSRSMALAYLDDAKEFLNFNRGVYPEWEIENVVVTGINFFKV